MSPSVVWMVAALAMGEGPEVLTTDADATDCSSRVGRSLKMSRSPDLSLFESPQVLIFYYQVGDRETHSGSKRVNM